MVYSGLYKAKNVSKYKGDHTNIIYRSLWERAVFQWCDNNPNVKGWCSEEVVIPYYYDVDKKYHKYYVDVKIVFEEKYSTNYDSLYKSTNTLPGKYNYYDSEWHPYYKDTDLHTMQSVSKSFTSTAIAIANKNGDIPDLNEEIMNYFQEFTSKNHRLVEEAL